MQLFPLNGVGVDGDGGSIGELVLYAGGVHVEVAIDWGVHF